MSVSSRMVGVAARMAAPNSLSRLSTSLMLGTDSEITGRLMNGCTLSGIIIARTIDSGVA